MALNITPTQAHALDVLRMEGLGRKLKMELARAEYEKALAREKAVYSWALERCSVKVDEQGEPITESYQLPEEVFVSEYVDLIQQGYKVLFNLDYARNYTPVHSEYFKPYLHARTEYRLIAVEFLRICGQTEAAEQLKKALSSYVSPRIEQQLDSITEEFIGGTAK